MRLPWYIFLPVTLGACFLTYWITKDVAYDRAIDNSEILEEYYYDRVELCGYLYFLHLLNEGSTSKLRDHLYSGIRTKALTLYIANPKFADLWHASARVPDQTLEWRRQGLEQAFEDLGKGPSKVELSELVNTHLSRKELARERQR